MYSSLSRGHHAFLLFFFFFPLLTRYSIFLLKYIYTYILKLVVAKWDMKISPEKYIQLPWNGFKENGAYTSKSSQPLKVKKSHFSLSYTFAISCLLGDFFFFSSFRRFIFFLFGNVCLVWVVVTRTYILCQKSLMRESLPRAQWLFWVTEGVTRPGEKVKRKRLLVSSHAIPFGCSPKKLVRSLCSLPPLWYLQQKLLTLL